MIKRNKSQTPHHKSHKQKASRNQAWKESRKLFFKNLTPNTQVTEIWKTFKQWGRISDIILPSKKDKFGNRFRFIVANNTWEAQRIMIKAGSIKFKGVPVRLDWARAKKPNMLHDGNKKTIP